MALTGDNGGKTASADFFGGRTASADFFGGKTASANFLGTINADDLDALGFRTAG